MAIGDVNKIGEAFVAVKYNLDGLDQSLRQVKGKVSQQTEELARQGQEMRRRLGLAVAGIAAGFAAAGVAMVRSSLAVVDSQTKLGRSLGTTTKSIQVLERAGKLAGVSFGEIQQATLQLTRRLSQAAGGAGPAAEALEKLRLTAAGLQQLPLDERIAAIQEALSRYVPAAQRAAVASALFGDRAGLVFSRIDTATLRTATRDVEDFGVAVSEQDAAQIERTNDALSRLQLIFRGVANQLAVAVAPALEAFADGLARIAARTGPLGTAIRVVFDNLNILAGLAAGAATLALIKLAGAAGTALTAIRLLTIGIAATPFGLIALAVAGVVAALVAFRDRTIEVGGVTIRVGGVINAVWVSVAAAIRLVIDNIFAMGEALAAVARGDFAGVVEIIRRRVGEIGASFGEVGEAWGAAFRAGIAEAIDGASGEMDRAAGLLDDTFDLSGLVGGTDEAARAVRTIGDEIRDVRFETMLVGLDEAGAAALRTARALGLVRDIAGDLDSPDASSLFSVQDGASEEVLRLQRALQALGDAQDAVAASAARTAELDGRAISVRESLRTEAERYAVELNRLDELYQTGRISVEEFAAAMAKLDEQFAKIPSATSRFDQLRDSIDQLNAQMGSLQQRSQDAMIGFAQGVADYALEAGNAYEQMRRLGERAMQGLENAIVDFAMTGKLQVREMVQSILADLARLAVRQGISQLLGIGLTALSGAIGSYGATSGAAAASSPTGASLGPRRFASGGRFTVAGTGGVDSSLVQFKATPGEIVEVFRGSREYRESMGKGGARGGDSFSIAIDARGADAGVEMRIESAVKRAVQQAKAATRDESLRSGRYAGAFG